MSHATHWSCQMSSNNIRHSSHLSAAESALVCTCRRGNTCRCAGRARAPPTAASAAAEAGVTRPLRDCARATSRDARFARPLHLLLLRRRHVDLCPSSRGDRTRIAGRCRPRSRRRSDRVRAIANGSASATAPTSASSRSSAARAASRAARVRDRVRAARAPTPALVARGDDWRLPLGERVFLRAT